MLIQSIELGFVMRLIPYFFLVIGFAFCGEYKLTKNDWAQWRGPNNNSIANSGQNPPIEWSESKNVKWKTPVPGRGHGSPIVVGDKVFLPTAEEDKQLQSILCYNRDTGKLLWKKIIHKGKFARQIHVKNTHASQTMASDGKLVFNTFHNADHIWVTALDMKGNIAWQVDVGEFKPEQYKFGYGQSPTLYKDMLIVSLQCDTNAYLIAYNKNTGKEVWKTKRDHLLSWSSPIIAKVAGRIQLLLSGCEKVSSYNPDNGKLLWAQKGTTMATCGTMVWKDNLVFANGGYPRNQTVCIKADGTGEVVWKNSIKIYEPSMIIVGDYLYGVTDKGIAYCWEAKSGKRMWKEKIASKVSSSLVLANGNFYLMDLEGASFVFKPNPKKYEVVKINQLGNDSYTTPAICNGEIFTRVGHKTASGRQEYLYCLAKK